MFGGMDWRHLPPEFCGGAGSIQFAREPGPCRDDGAIYALAIALHRDERGSCLSGCAFHAIKFGCVDDTSGVGASGADDPAHSGVAVLR